MIASLVIFCCLVCIDLASAQCGPGFTIATYYSSNMVVQRPPARPRFWGYAGTVGQEVRVTLNTGGQVVITNAIQGPEGRPIWEAIFQPITDPGPHTITFFSGSCSFTHFNILVGDVWLCSGQSNMAHRLDNIDQPDPELDDVINYPEVRTFWVNTVWSDTPLVDLPFPVRNWAGPSRANMAGFSAVCWLFGRDLYRKYGRPIGLIETNWGGTRIEAWSSPEALQQCFPNVAYQDPPNGASQLYNSMIYPLLPMPIYGAIWYQGEANTNNAQYYSCAIKAMVNDWRIKWFSRSPETDIAFPFGQVQLAPWRNANIDTGFPDVRWEQTDRVGYTPNLNMNKFFLAVAIDLPDFNSPYGDIHPRYKRQVASRLALAAQYVAYDEPGGGVYQGPTPTAITNEGDGRVRISYATPLQYRTTISGFELCCGASPANTCMQGGRWVEAFFQQGSTQEIFLSNPCAGGESVTGFRYLWRESPCVLESCPIYSIENSLPAPPYQYHGVVLQGHPVHL